MEKLNICQCRKTGEKYELLNLDIENQTVTYAEIGSFDISVHQGKLDDYIIYSERIGDIEVIEGEVFENKKFKEPIENKKFLNCSFVGCWFDEGIMKNVEMVECNIEASVLLDQYGELTNYGVWFDSTMMEFSNAAENVEE